MCNATWASAAQVDRLIDEGCVWALLSAIVWAATGTEDTTPPDIPIFGPSGRKLRNAPPDGRV
eukprot:SAG11_NODE_36525_length_261_cov_0.635802_1_plen_62_part_01